MTQAQGLITLGSPIGGINIKASWQQMIRDERKVTSREEWEGDTKKRQDRSSGLKKTKMAILGLRVLIYRYTLALK